MSFALSAAARDDVDISYDKLPADDDASSTLWALLRATCFDACQGAQKAKSLEDFAQSCIVFGNVSKLVKPERPNSTATSSTAVEPSPSMNRAVAPPRLVKRPWGNVLRSWTAPTVLEPFASIPSAPPQTGLPLDDNLQPPLAADDTVLQVPAVAAPRILALPLAGSDFLGMYSPVKLKAGKGIGHCGAYLLNDALLFIYKDASGLLHIHRQIHLADVEHVGVSNGHAISVRTVFRFSSPSRPSLDESVGEAEYVYTNYNFSVDSTQLVGNWLSSLKAQLLALTPNHPISSRPAPKPRPPKSKKREGSSTQEPEPFPTWAFAGVVFLSLSPGYAGEYSLGVAVLPQYSSDGLATYAIARVLEKAFEKLRAHRVQARVIRTDAGDASRAVCKFVHLGFTHEGILRRALMHPVTKCWTDVSVLSILDVDWAVRRSVRPPPPSAWDEMFDRHQREREHLRALGGGLRRTKSMETIRDLSALSLLDGIPTSSLVGRWDESGASSASSAVAPRTESGVSATTSWDEVSTSSYIGSEDGILHRWASGHAADELSYSWDDVDEDGYSNDG